MAQVIKAVETYGRQDAYRLIGLSRDLPQTEESIAWVIDELNDEQSDEYENYTYNLSMVLVEADPALLLPKESADPGGPPFPSRPASGLHRAARGCSRGTRRLAGGSWKSSARRRRQAVHQRGRPGPCRRIVEALARHGEECEEKVHALLGQKVEDYGQSPMKWMEPLVVRLAGQAHLDSTVPLLVTKLLEDGGDVLNEECAEALTRIGTPAVLHAVAEAFPGAGDHFRLYATEPLEHIHSDLAVETCLHLLGQETGCDDSE